MCNVDLEKHLDRIGIAYETSAFTDGIRLESEEDIKKFEANYASIPSDYRWLLLNLGGCYLVEPWIFDLKELEENYTIFVDAYEEYMSECEHGPAFPIGGLGDGSIVFIDVESGKVRGYNNDYADLEEISDGFSELILDLVEQVEYFADKI